MNKNIIIMAVIASILTGCFGFFEKEKPKPAAQPAASAEQTVPRSKEPQSAIQQPPSFDDGDIYLEALAKKDASRCAKIQNQKLRTRCEGQIKK